MAARLGDARKSESHVRGSDIISTAPAAPLCSNEGRTHVVSRQASPTYAVHSRSLLPQQSLLLHANVICANCVPLESDLQAGAKEP